ncbi:14359_t:CDS:2, partial [Acaulospora morrowiae]
MSNLETTNSEGFDVIIKVGEKPNEKEFKAKKSILTSKSEYYKISLTENWERKENGYFISVMPHISPSVFEVLLKYINTGDISVENNKVSLVDILIASDELQISGAYPELERRLLKNKSSWKPSEIFTVLQLDHLDHLTTLYNSSIELICRKPKKFFESEYFFKMKEAPLIKILKCDDLELEKYEIWEYLI